MSITASGVPSSYTDLQQFFLKLTHNLIHTIILFYLYYLYLKIIKASTSYVFKTLKLKLFKFLK